MIDKTEHQVMKNWNKDNSKPLVSICTITYNHEKYIADALDSFLMQETDFPFEILIDEDCSLDSTADIIRTYMKKFPNIINATLRDKNLGGGINSIENYKKAKGKYIALCEGDDYWTDPLKLQKQVNFLESHEEYNMVFHNAELQIHTENGVTIKPFNPEEKSRDYTADEILKTWSVTTASVLCRNERQYRYIEDNLSFPVHDTPYFIKCASLGKLYYMSDKMSVYRRVPTGFMASEHIKTVEFSLNFIKYLKTLYNDFGDLLSKKTINYKCAIHYLGIARRLKDNDEKKDYLKYLFLAASHDPELVYEEEIVQKFSLENTHINTIRDSAVALEKKNINFAHDLMEIAHKARPNGPFIEKKLNEYKSIIKENEH